jgi:hypothetical protein
LTFLSLQVRHPVLLLFVPRLFRGCVAAESEAGSMLSGHGATVTAVAATVDHVFNLPSSRP